MKKLTERSTRITWLGLGLVLFSSFTAHAVEVSVSHPTMDQRLGYPAIIQPGGAFPSLSVTSPTDGTLEVELVNTETNAVLQTHAPRALSANTPASVTFTGALPADGLFRVDLRVLESQAVVFRDAYFFSVINTAALLATHSKIAHPDTHGRMRYVPDVRGNRLPDFSGVGYLGGADLPVVPTVITLQPEPGDATQRIQNAIDAVSALAPDANGFRGAVELTAGLYEIATSLRIQQSGVVLRGVGPGNRQAFTLNPTQNLSLEQWQATMEGTTSTVLVATGTTYRAILTIGGTSGMSLQNDTSTEIVNEYVPVGQRWFHVANPEYYSVGDTIQLERRGNADWISHLKMDQIPPRGDGSPIIQWTPFNLNFEYTIKAIQGDRITVDSGLVCAVEKRWGGGRIRRYTEGGRIRHSGVENLRAVSFWRINANGKDNTKHADRFVSFANMRDGWARNVAAEHFSVNTVGQFFTANGTLAITIQDCSALAAASSFYSGTGYDSSGRYWLEDNTYVGRYGFLLSGQKGLVRGCYTINNRHAFALSSRVPGPNVFSNCTGSQSLTYSEPHHRWSVGGLYDNVSDKEFSLMNRLNMGSGHGWAGANYVAWNTKGALTCEQPPTAQNWAIGHKSTRANGPFHSWNLSNYGVSYGYWESLGTHVVPQSLYTQQIADRESETQDYLILQDGSSETTGVLPQGVLSLDVIAEIGPDLAPESISYQWSTLSGPGTPVFSNPQDLQTSVVLDLPGTYVVELRTTSTQVPLLDERIEFTLTLMQPPAEVDTAGGTVEIVESGPVNYRIHKFTSTGSHSFEVQAGTGEVEVLVVAGGGGGGGSSLNRWGGAGGGAGGMIETKVNVTPGVYSIQVGNGGIGAVGAGGTGGFGENSNFGDLVALGGGRGRGQNSPTNGGSGSGGAPMTSDTQSNAPGTGLQPSSLSGGYGNNGGIGTASVGDDRAGGGGGGAGAEGAGATLGRGGAGGAGRGSAISGTFTLYAGGGGGAGRTAAGSGGSGGGGNGGLNANGSPGAPNTGGGGGASSLGDPHSGGNGGSGIVIVRVPVPKPSQPLVASTTQVGLQRSQTTGLPELSWTPSAGVAYVIQESEDLVQWSNTGNIIYGTGNPVVHVLPEIVSDRAFFRLIEIGQNP